MYHAGLKSIKTLKSWMKYCELASDFATLKGNTHLQQLIIDRWIYHQNINSPLMLFNLPLTKNRSLVTYTFKQRSTVIHLLEFSIDSAYWRLTVHTNPHKYFTGNTPFWKSSSKQEKFKRRILFPQMVMHFESLEAFHQTHEQRPKTP